MFRLPSLHERELATREMPATRAIDVGCHCGTLLHAYKKMWEEVFCDDSCGTMIV